MSNSLYSKERFAQRLVSSAAPFLLLGCSTMPMGPGTVMAQTLGEQSTAGANPALAQAQSPQGGSSLQAGSAAPRTSGSAPMDGQLMFELMIAELAGRRGQLDVAMTGYLRAAEHTDDPRVSERATRLAMYGRQWQQAEKACKRWLQLDPEAADAQEILAQALLRQGKTDEATAIYVRLLDESDTRDRLLRQFQSELLSLEDPAQAIQVMQVLLESVPGSAQAHLVMAHLQLSGKDREKALDSVEEALRLDAGNDNALLLKAQLLIAAGRPDEAFTDVEADLARDPKQLSLRLGYAQLLVEAGRFDNVGEQLDALYDNTDRSPDTLLTIGMLALDARRMERARKYLRALTETGSYPDQANFYLARIADQQQDYITAIEHYEAVGEGELQLPAQIRVAELMGMIGKLDEGREKLRQLGSLVADPDVQTQLLTAESRMLQKAGQAPEAVKVLTDGLSQFPEDADLLYARALAAEVAGDNAMMMMDLNSLIESDPENAHALNALGYHLADNNQELERAEQLLVKANALLPNDPAIMDSLGWLRYRQGQLEDAISMLRSAYNLYPDTEIAAHLGEALWLNGNEEEARQLIEDALLDAPDDVRLLQVMQKYSE